MDGSSSKEGIQVKKCVNSNIAFARTKLYVHILLIVVNILNKLNVPMEKFEASFFFRY